MEDLKKCLFYHNFVTTHKNDVMVYRHTLLQGSKVKNSTT